MIRIVLCLAIAFWASATAAKPRVASINMCTDQLVLALADDEQIVGLSSLARDPALSYYHRRAQRFPALSGTVEDALLARPDLIVTATLAKPETTAFLTRSGRTIAAFADARTLSEAKQQISRMGALLDQAARAEAAIAAIDHAIAVSAPVARPLSVLPLERRGWITGRETLLTDLLERAGLHNLAAPDVSYGTRLPLERLVAMRPDRLLLTTSTPGAEDQGSAFLHHPALAGLKGRGTIVIPENLIVCAGPMIVEALQRLRAAATP